MSKNRNNRGSIFKGFLAIALLLLATVIFFSRGFLSDQLVVWSYTPTTEVQSIVKRTAMTNHGKFMFYVGSPRVEDAIEFNQNCSRKEQNVAVLGCYQGKIHIYNVTDGRLDGIKEVTAAHEMLHAAYERLSDSRRQEVNNLIEAEYDKLKNDENLSKRMSFYARTEPGERDNELHSVIATEVKNVSPQLEAYYAQYFKDRSKVVALHDAYNIQFTSLKARADEISDEMKRLKTEVTQESRDYKHAVESFNKEVEAFNRLAESGGFENDKQYESSRIVLEQRSESLEVMRAAINAKIDQFNALRGELQSISTRSEDLNESIDSSLKESPRL